jgi:hypothetical protein
MQGRRPFQVVFLANSPPLSVADPLHNVSILRDRFRIGIARRPNMAVEAISIRSYVTHYEASLSALASKINLQNSIRSFGVIDISSCGKNDFSESSSRIVMKDSVALML